MKENKETLIPKKIHYCWFGKKEKPKSVIDCINSWKKICPDFEIIEWNEDNINLNMNLYTKQAYEARVWGFVPDYLRCWIIFTFGGIYLDTDVEIIKNPTPLLDQQAFCGIEKEGDSFYINFGHGFGAAKGNSVIKAHMDLYDNMKFKTNKGYNETPSPTYTTQILERYGFDNTKNAIQRLGEITVYPNDYFDPFDWKFKKLCKTSNTYFIHWYSSSWMTPEQRRAAVHNGKLDVYRKKYGKNFATIYDYVFWSQKKNGGQGFLKTVAQRFKR